MFISLTCTCGQQQFVANEYAGRTTACVMCGRTLTVPAMGKLVTPPAPKPKPARKQRRSLVPALLISIVAVALLGATGFLAYAIIERSKVADATPIVQGSEQPEQPRDIQPPLPVERKSD